MRPPPKLNLTSVSTSATTYTFHASGDFGWALCTVNDATGELIITSDWGNWSYLWDTRPHSGLGCCNLTYFIGCNRSNGTPRTEHDYFAMKLLGRRGAERFSAEKTLEHFHQRLCEARREYPDGKLTREIARDLWEEISELGRDVGDYTEGASTLFAERFMHIDNYELLSEEPWEEIQTETSFEYTILTETILPALGAACYERSQRPEYQELQAKFEVESAAREATYKAEREALQQRVTTP